MNDPEWERLLRVYEGAGWVRMVRDAELWLANLRKVFEIVTLRLEEGA